MGIFQTQNPGIGGLDELTDIETAFIQSIVYSSYNEGDVLTIDGGVPIWLPPSGGSGSGTVTSISSGTGISTTPDPITNTGTISLSSPIQAIVNLSGNSGRYLRVNISESSLEYAQIPSPPVTSVNGLTGDVVIEKTYVKTMMPFFPFYANSSGGRSFLNVTHSNNTEMFVGQVSINHNILCNKISFSTGNTITTPGTVDVTLYSEDCQTVIFSVSSATLSLTNTIYTITLPTQTEILSGVYYIAVNSNSSFNGTLQYYYSQQNGEVDDGAIASLQNISTLPVIQGIVSITASTPPTDFSPIDDITQDYNKVLIFRLDN